jgi:hypothetical protein
MIAKIEILLNALIQICVPTYNSQIPVIRCETPVISLGVEVFGAFGSDGQHEEETLETIPGTGREATTPGPIIFDRVRTVTRPQFRDQ